MVVTSDGTYLIISESDYPTDSVKELRVLVTGREDGAKFYLVHGERKIPLLESNFGASKTYTLSYRSGTPVHIVVYGSGTRTNLTVDVALKEIAERSIVNHKVLEIYAPRRALVSNLYPIRVDEYGLSVIPAAAAFQSYGANYDELSNNIACQGIQLREAVKEFSQPRDDEDNTTHSIACTDITLTTVVKEFSQPRDDEDNTTHSLACTGITLDEVVVIHSQPRDDLDNTTHTVACIGIELNEA